MIDALRRLAIDEDFVADVGKNVIRPSATEWEDRAFNDGVEAARAAIIERINPAVIVAALERLQQLEAPVVGYVWTGMDGTELVLDPDEVTVLKESKP